MDSFERYGNEIKEFLNINDAGLSALKVEFNRAEKLPLMRKHPFFFHGVLSLVSNILYFIFGLNRKVLLSDEAFVFISCPDPIFRTKNIKKLAGKLDFSIVYLPNFHIKDAIRYKRYFNSIEVKAFFPTIKIRDVIFARKTINEFLRNKKNCLDTIDYDKLLSVLSHFLIYDNVVKRLLRGTGAFKGKWLIEHQIYFFVPVITNLRLMGRESTMLQHGLCFKPTTDFFPLHCDNVLCCSEREKEIYLKEGVETKRVKVLGIPLQTMNEIEEGNAGAIEYNLLILLTYVDEKNAHLIGEVLDFVSQNVDRVLLRFRPRSKDNDKKLLENHIGGFSFSDSEHSINQDIARCEKVITFSADAIVEVVKLKKAFLYFWLKEYQDFLQEIQCATMENYKERIRSLMEASEYSNKMIDMSNYMVGEQRIEVIRERFNSYIQA